MFNVSIPECSQPSQDSLQRSICQLLDPGPQRQWWGLWTGDLTNWGTRPHLQSLYFYFDIYQYSM